ncbi:MAG: hypothetical protein EOP83_25790, partial [Verrucomicrobiaceae bacterium]
MSSTTVLAATSAFALSLSERAAAKVAAGGGIKALNDGRQDQFRLNPFAIFVLPDFNSRDFDLPENVEHVEDLKRSMIAKGFDPSKPVEVFQGKDGRYYLVDGECRLRGVIAAINDGAEIESIPVVISKGKSDGERIASQFTSNMGKGFNEIEMAKGVRNLLGLGWDEAKVAERTALRPAKVSRLIRILELPEQITAMVKTGTVAMSFALDTYKAAKTDQEAIETLKKGQQAAAAVGRTK